MRMQDLRFLYDFNYWARDRILATGSQLSPEEFLAPVESNYGSLQATLVHILSAERVWRIRCQERRSPTALLVPNDFPSLEALRSFWLDEQSRMMAYLDGLEVPDLDEQISYRRTGDQAQSNILWHILAHVVMHGIDRILSLRGCICHFEITSQLKPLNIPSTGLPTRRSSLPTWPH